jgi:hypothetical protein
MEHHLDIKEHLYRYSEPYRNLSVLHHMFDTACSLVIGETRDPVMTCDINNLDLLKGMKDSRGLVVCALTK